MKKVEINNYEELFQVLDRLNESIYIETQISR